MEMNCATLVTMLRSTCWCRSFASVCLAVFLLAGFSPITARAEGSFSDVSSSHPAFAAVEYVKAQGIMTGNPNGTFAPGSPFTRAASAKVLVLTKMSEADVQAVTERTFTDIPEGAWYRRYAEAARIKGIVGAAASFNGDRTVKKAEFLKMLLSSQGADPNAFSEIRLALSTDVTDPDAWYYPWMRRGITDSLIQIQQDGKLGPDRDLTRADAAQLLYRYAMYQAGKRTQALLSEEESELVNVLQALEAKEFAAADMASARALLAARGAHASKPSVAIVQAAVKIAESFRALVRGYKAGTEGRLDDALALAKEAWALAEKAKQLSPDLGELSGRVQTIAKAMADQAREMLKQGTASSS